MWGFALPFVVAGADALSLIFSKFFLRRFGRLSYREFNWLAFLGILTVLVILSILFDLFPIGIDMMNNWSTLLALGSLGAVGNILFFRSLEEERVSNIEPFVVFNPLAAILVASIFVPEERSLVTYGAIGLAAAILLWAHLNKSKFTMSRALRLIMIFWVVYGLEVTLVQHLLQTFEPVSLYLIRCSIVFILLTLATPPNFRIIRPHHLPFSFVLGGLAVTAVTLLYWSIQLVGVSSSLFVLVISPTLVYWFSGKVLKDRWSPRNVIASILIVLLVVSLSIWRLL